MFRVVEPYWRTCSISLPLNYGRDTLGYIYCITHAKNYTTGDATLSGDKPLR